MKDPATPPEVSPFSVPYLDSSARLSPRLATEHTEVRRKSSHSRNDQERLIAQQRHLMAVMKAITANGDVASICRLVRDAMIELSLFDRAGFWLVEGTDLCGTWGTDIKGNVVDERAYRQPLARFLDQFPDLRNPTLRFVLNPNVEEVMPDGDIQRNFGQAFIPLRVGDDLIAILMVDNLLSLRNVGPQNLEITLLFCEQVAEAITKTRVLAEREFAIAQERRITTLALAIANETETDTIFRLVRDEIVELGTIDRAGVWLLEGNRACGTWGTDEFGQLRDEHTKSFLIDHADLERLKMEPADFTPSELSATCPHSVIPMKSGNAVIGIITVDNLLTMRPITDAILQPIIPLAQQAAVAVQNASLLRQANEELKRREAVEAELRIQAEDLVAARDQALAGTRVRDQFMANMSHEMRTPLNGVLGMTSLLLNSPLTTQQTGFARTIHSSASALLSVIDAVLDFTGLETGKLALSERPFNLRQCVEEVVTAVSACVVEDAVELVCAIPPGFPEQVIGDANRIRQILMNLVGNAIKFTPRGRISVTVTCQRQSLAKAQLRIAVTDTGIGIAPDHQTAIFLGFSQIDPSSTRGYGGLGLGLGIADRLARLMGGKLSLSSELGKGSEFCLDLTLPLAPLPELIEPRWLGGRSILVVSPNPTLRVGIGDQLRHWGAHVTSADHLSDPDSTSPEPSLIVYHHPGPGPASATIRQSIRDAFTSPNIPVVLVFHPSRWPEEAAGFEGLLPKPCRQADLREVVSSILKPVGIPVLEARNRPTLGQRILLAEDNPVNAVVAQGLLEEWGCIVTWVENGVQALAALQTGTFDTVLMDISMPEMDGLEATRRIRLLDQARGTHQIVIALTAHAATRDRDACFQVGMDDFLTKPIQPVDMLDRLTFWQQKRVRRESATR